MNGVLMYSSITAYAEEIFNLAKEGSSDFKKELEAVGLKEGPEYVLSVLSSAKDLLHEEMKNVGGFLHIDSGKVEVCLGKLDTISAELTNAYNAINNATDRAISNQIH